MNYLNHSLNQRSSFSPGRVWMSLFLLMLVLAPPRVSAQCLTTPPTPAITAGGPASFCDGGSVTITTDVAMTANTSFVNTGFTSNNTKNCDCPSGYVAVGYTGRIGTWVDKFRLLCRKYENGSLVGPVVGTDFNGASNGGSQKPDFTFSGNTMIVGMKIDTYTPFQVANVGAVTGYGQDASYIEGNGDNASGYTTLASLAGAVSGTAGSVFVPAGHVVTGMTVYSDAFMAAGVSLRYRPIGNLINVASVTWSNNASGLSNTVTTSGSYTVTATSAEGCSTTSAAFNVTVNPLPSTPVVTALSPTSFCPGGSVTLVTSAGGNLPFQNTQNASGSPVNCDCPQGYVAVGYTGRAGSWMDKFQLLCQQYNNGTLSGPVTGTCFNGFSNGGSQKPSFTLGSNKALVGMRVDTYDPFTTTHVGNITGYGQTAAYISGNGDNTSGYTTLNTLGGAASATTGTVWAPAGTVITGMTIYNGSFFAESVSFRYKPISDLNTTVTAMWSNGASGASTTVSAAGNYTVTVTDANGCSATSAPTAVSIHPLPAAYDVTGGGSYCDGGTGVAVGLSNSETSTSYQLQLNGVNTGSPVAGTGAAISFGEQIDAGTYTVVATSGNGCISNMNGSAAVSINSLPATPVITADGPTTICQGQSVALSIPGVGGNLPFQNTQNASGSPVNCDCPQGYVAVGYTGRAGSWMDKFQLLCQQYNNGTLSGPITGTCFNGFSNGGSQKPSFTLGSNKALVGMRVDTYDPFTTTHVGNITGYGQTVAYISGNGDNTSGYTTLNTLGGAASGTAGTVFAPVGSAITGMTIYNGSFFAESVSFRYKPLNDLAGTTTALWSNATTGGMAVVNTAGNYTVTITDANGCSATSAPVAVTVNNAPAFTSCPQNITANNTAGACAANIAYENLVAATGTPAPALTYSFSGVTTGNGNGTGSGSQFNVGVTNVMITATNSCGTATCSFTVTISDNENPVVNCPANATVACDASTATTATGVATATDNCGVASITHSDISTQDANANNAGHYNYTITRTWTATDVNGNTGSCAQTIAVQDVTAPVIACPSNTTVSCDGSTSVSANGTATATDNCSGVAITHSDVSTQDANANNAGHYNYTITRTWTATDITGNASNCVQTITVQDVTAPVIACPSNTTVSCDASTSVSANGTATATDNCSGVTITHSDASTQDANANNAGHYNYTITRIWTATDVTGNASSCTQTITVQDVTAPVVTCPSSTTVGCDASTSVSANGTATATDNCSGVTITHSDASTQDANTNNAGHYNYVITRTWTATDVTGNASNCVQTITVQDVTAPVVTCPSSTTVSCDASTAVAANGTATGTDNCSPVAITHSDVSTQDANANNAGHYNYVITRTWTATDVTGNASSCTQTITVQDVTAPVVTCPSNTTVSCDASTAVAANGTATGTDNCSGVTITHSDASTQSANVNDAAHYNYTITRTWTATDVTGNATSCAQTITVQDVTAPVITCPADATVSCKTSVADNGNATATDNCSPVAITHTDASTQDPNPANSGHYNYTITRTWTATDVTGNATTCNQVITVHALNNAAIAINPVNTINANHQNHTIYLGYGAQSVTLSATANDGVGTRTYSWSPTTGVANPTSASTSVSPQVTTTYTVTITDATGCSITQSFTVNVIDVRCGEGKVKICHKAPAPGSMGNGNGPGNGNGNGGGNGNGNGNGGGNGNGNGNGNNSGNTLCLQTSNIAIHLSHGDILGDCPQAKGGNNDDEGHYDDHMNDLVVNEMKVYPNPNNGAFTVELPAGMENANVVITDMAGKVIQKQGAMLGSKLQFDLGDVASGVYMLHVTSGTQTYRSKISVQ